MPSVHTQFALRMRQATPFLLAPCLLALAGSPARADNIEDPILGVAKASVLGGVLGLVLGGVTALVVDTDKRDDAVRWGVVAGTFGGFVYGIYAVSNRDDDFFGGDPDDSAGLEAFLRSRSSLRASNGESSEHVSRSGTGATYIGSATGVATEFSRVPRAEFVGSPFAEAGIGRSKTFAPDSVPIDADALDFRSRSGRPDPIKTEL